MKMFSVSNGVNCVHKAPEAKWLSQVVFILIIAAGLFVGVGANAADTPACFCWDDLTNLTAENAKLTADNYKAVCAVTVTKAEDCVPEKQLKSDGKRYNDCKPIPKQTDCVSQAAEWEKLKVKKIIGETTATPSAAVNTSGGFVSKLIPDCAMADTVTGDCRSINIFVILAIKVISYLFSIIGGVSLIMFVYGGFLLVLSEGSEEKITQAKEVLTAVVVGLLIAFGGYLLVTFVGQVVGIDREFRLK